MKCLLALLLPPPPPPHAPALHLHPNLIRLLTCKKAGDHVDSNSGDSGGSSDDDDEDVSDGDSDSEV